MTIKITTEEWVAKNFVQVDPWNVDENKVVFVHQMTFRTPGGHMVLIDNIELSIGEKVFWIARKGALGLAELYLADGAGFDVYMLPNEEDPNTVDVILQASADDPIAASLPTEVRFDLLKDMIEHTDTTGQIEEFRKKIDRESAEVRAQLESAKAKLMLCGDPSDPLTQGAAELLNALDEHLGYLDSVRAQVR